MAHQRSHTIKRGKRGILCERRGGVKEIWKDVILPRPTAPNAPHDTGLDGYDAGRRKGAGDAIGVRQRRQREHRLEIHGWPPAPASGISRSILALARPAGKPASISPLSLRAGLKRSPSARKAPPKTLPAGYFDKGDAADRRAAQSVVNPWRTLSRHERPRLSNANSWIE